MDQVNVLIDFLQTVEKNQDIEISEQSEELRALLTIFKNLHSNVYVVD